MIVFTGPRHPQRILSGRQPTSQGRHVPHSAGPTSSPVQPTRDPRWTPPHCTLDKTTYTALEFSRLPGDEIENKRRALTCPGHACGSRAFYRRRSRDGRAAHFGSTSHHPGCDAATPGPPAAGNGHDDDRTEMLNLGEELIIDTRAASAPGTQHHDPDQHPSSATPTPRHVRGDEHSPHRARGSKRLRPILGELRRSPAFARAGRTVKHGSWPAMTDRDFFHEIPSLTAEHALREETKGGHWGTIISIGDTNAGLWLNFGPPGTAGVVVPVKTTHLFRDQTGISELEDLVGSSLIVLTELEVSQRGKPYLRLPSDSDWAWLPFTDAQS